MSRQSEVVCTRILPDERKVIVAIAKERKTYLSYVIRDAIVAYIKAHTGRRAA